ncbi:hypothetical protein MKW94_007652, partial [Papaver nudicaule]|nr:hypothetical protein [Papaver nudicaule]
MAAQPFYISPGIVKLDPAARQEKIKTSRTKLLNSRDEVLDLLEQQEWKNFTVAEATITDYVLLLSGVPYQCFGDRTGLDVHLGILKRLQARLEKECTQAKDQYYDLRLSVLDYDRKRAMMLQELNDAKDRGGISEDLRKWIDRQLLDEDWKGSLEAADKMEKQYMGQAAEDAQEVHYVKQIIDLEPIYADNPETVKSRFMSCSKELGDATNKMQENSRAYTQAPPLCLCVKKLWEFLEANRSLVPE